MKLIIVESPTKAKIIQNFLGNKDFDVVSSGGHIRDLPQKKLGVDIEKNFQPTYVILPKAKKTVSLLKNKIKNSESIILATDEDREGESIAWHILQSINIKPQKPHRRIVFHEITKQAIEKALKNPRDIDMNLVNAQQARRILDRLFGYKLSPLLWKKISKGLSAGRVQSVAVRLICEREKEIENFIPQEYWTIIANLCKIEDAKSKNKNNEFEALLIKKNKKIIPKLGIKTKKEAYKILKDLEGAIYKVEKIEKKEIKRNPLPPFITSTLQQTAYNKFKWSAKYTMKIAQQLYETGYITYHRSDSLNLSNSALEMAKNFIIKNFGKNYYQFRKYKTKSKTAQEAHEAIRPTFAENSPEKLKNKLEKNQFKLYDLIWRRFIASQASQAIFASQIININAKNYTFQATGQTLKFDGFLKFYPIQYKENTLPLLQKDEILKLKKLTPAQHFTKPPSRYTEATLIKMLEKYGIGRPSTYAPIISTIQERNYVEKDENKKLQPTEIGILTNNLLVENFPNIINVDFTKKIEDKLDDVASGKIEWQKVVGDFYFPFEKILLQKEKDLPPKSNLWQETKEICPKCKAPLVLKYGRFGKFYACLNWPKCKYTKDFKETLDLPCPKCKNGKIIKRKTKKGKIFYGCSNWPKCDFSSWKKPK